MYVCVLVVSASHGPTSLCLWLFLDDTSHKILYFEPDFQRHFEWNIRIAEIIERLAFLYFIIVFSKGFSWPSKKSLCLHVSCLIGWRHTSLPNPPRTRQAHSNRIQRPRKTSSQKTYFPSDFWKIIWRS